MTPKMPKEMIEDATEVQNTTSTIQRSEQCRSRSDNLETEGAMDLEKGADETIDNLCSVCIRRNKNTEAQKFCTDCEEYYCSICFNSHNDFSALRNHQILDKANFKTGSSVQFPMLPTERCKVHGHKPVDMYCRQHDAVGCLTCMFMQHSSCKDTEYIPDYIKRVKVENSSAIVEQLGTISSSLCMLQENFLKEKTNLTSRKDKSMQEIRKLRQEINKQLDKLEKNTVDDLEGVFQSLNHKIEATLRELQTEMTEVQSAQDSLKSAGNNASQMLVCIKMANNVATHADKKLTTHHQVSSTEISFVSNHNLQSLFNKAEALGSISISEEFKSQPRGSNPLSSVDTIQTSALSHGSQSSISLLQVKDSKKYTMRETSGSGADDIKSVCELDDGTIIMSNCDQRKLMRLDSLSYMVRDSCAVPPFPCQVCTISSQEVAVCCSLANLIQFVSIELTMQKTRQIETGFYCVGIAYNDEKLYISDNFSLVCVYTITGDRLQQFSLSLSKPGFFGRLFGSNDLMSIALSSDGSVIYIPHYRKGLIILDRNGQIVGECTDSIIKGARGVCLDKNNSVLVCGQDSKNVLQFTPDGKLIGEVLKRDKGCYALCFCKKTSKLIVCMDDEIEVYSIKA